MIGTFTTTKYASREELISGRPFEVSRSTNRLTNVGLEWMWKAMAGIYRAGDGVMTDHLAAARLVVGTSDTPFTAADERLYGDMTAEAPLDSGYPRIEGPVVIDADEGIDGYRLVLRATFGEDVAAFDWHERGVLTAQGVLLDRSVRDQGRKVLGAIWQLEAALEITR